MKNSPSIQECTCIYLYRTIALNWLFLEEKEAARRNKGVKLNEDKGLNVPIEVYHKQRNVIDSISLSKIKQQQHKKQHALPEI